MIAPVSRVSAIAGTVDTPRETSSQATIMPPKPASAPIAKSNAPAASGIEKPTATSPVIAWLLSMECQLLEVRNVEGTQIEKIANSRTKT